MNQIDLLKLNVNEHVEKKNGLSYLSWAWAWAEALKADPNATFEVKTFHTVTNDAHEEVPYLNVNGTAMVWVTVTMFNKPITCFLPVMNSSNQPITMEGRKYKDRRGEEKIEKLDAFNVNTAIMRCMTKGLALHGLGLYIYAGEDLPEDSQKEEVAPVTVKAVNAERNTIADVEVNTGDADANAVLFADSMIHYTDHCKEAKDLNSYWKANQTQIDSLKKTHLDLYDKVRNRFAELKKQLTDSKE
jgi:hypothetical protein